MNSNCLFIDNLLPFDGEVLYHGKIYNQSDSDLLFHHLLNNIAWKNDEAMIMGKTIVTKRKVAWYGNQPYAYTYSKTTKLALPWTNELIEIKRNVEAILNEQFNSCLLNLYHNGDEGMAYHSDDEKTLKQNGTIASLSFGAERKFFFKHKKNATRIGLSLHHGSLLVMKGTTQQNWLHRLPPTKKVTTARINLTFRNIII